MSSLLNIIQDIKNKLPNEANWNALTDVQKNNNLLDYLTDNHEHNTYELLIKIFNLAWKKVGRNNHTIKHKTLLKIFAYMERYAKNYIYE